MTKKNCIFKVAFLQLTFTFKQIYSKCIQTFVFQIDISFIKIISTTFILRIHAEIMQMRKLQDTISTIVTNFKFLKKFLLTISISYQNYCVNFS
jgi:hypothetical protein